MNIEFFQRFDLKSNMEIIQIIMPCLQVRIVLLNIFNVFSGIQKKNHKQLIDKWKFWYKSFIYFLIGQIEAIMGKYTKDVKQNKPNLQNMSDKEEIKNSPYRSE